MEEIHLESPISLREAVNSTEDAALMTIAAFMLSVGSRLSPEYRQQEYQSQEELDLLGILTWWETIQPDNESPDINEYRDYLGDEMDHEEDRRQYYGSLGELIYSVLEEPGNARKTRRALVKGLVSPDDIVRICALISAAEVFRFKRSDLFSRIGWFISRRLNPLAETLLSMFIARAFYINPAPPTTGFATARQSRQSQKGKGLILIHGTNFPPGRPVWSVPGSGPLFNYINNYRTDIYSDKDNFRWEGGYSYYAREVASQNLQDWISRRNLSGIDAITHSHGGNVLFAATFLGASFNKVIFLSCPVHWSIYRPALKSIREPRSIRIHFDLVIHADRGAQRFPKISKISETILPIWFTSHSDVTDPNVWTRNSLEQYL